MDYGIQMYSIRDYCKENGFEAGVAKMAEQGYKLIEPAGFYDLTAEEVNAILKKYDVKICSTHSSLDDLVNDFEGTVAFHKAIGNKTYIIPGYSTRNQQKLDYFVEKINELQPKLEAEGITLAFHNHHREFLPNEDGGQAYDQLIYRTNIKLQIDMFWAFVGMKDPIALMEKVKDRLIGMHMKDGFANGEGTPLGMGEAPVADVYAKAVEMGLPMVVESETQTPDGPTETKICIDYLRSLEK